MTDDPHQWPEEVRLAFQEALSRPLDPDRLLTGHTPHGGAGRPGETAPGTAQHDTTQGSGADAPALPTLTGGGNRPDLPHSAEWRDMTTNTEPTPAQLRDAWVSLMSGLELTLVTTREHARASRSMAQAILDDTGLTPGSSPADWAATAWAASKLLEALKALPAPELVMGHRYQKGSKRPDPKVKRDRGRAGKEYVPQGAIPWPELGDGTPWTQDLTLVRHPEAPGETGHLVRLEWAGGWWAIVHWPAAGRMKPETDARMALANLLPAEPGA